MDMPCLLERLNDSPQERTMAKKVHSHFDITLEVLSPLHIGDGSELLRDIDYVTQGERTWIINHEALYRDYLTGDARQDDQIINTPVADLLKPEDFEPPFEYFEYGLAGAPINRPLRSFIKSGLDGNPYIPGSTIKGMLRTVFLWGMYTVRQQQPDLNRLNRSRSWAAQRLERDMLGRNANEDLFRAVHVSDSETCETRHLHVGAVSVYPTSQKGKGIVVDAEVLRQTTEFHSRLSIEEYGFTNPEAAERLSWQGKQQELQRLVEYGKAFGGYRLAQEYEYYNGREGVETVSRFYNILLKQQEALGSSQFFAQLGWGTGWNSKTLNNLLTIQEHDFAHKVVRQYRLSRFARDFQPGQRFPMSRHVFQHNGKLVRPMGWVLVTIK